MAIIDIKNLSFAYSGEIILQDVNLSIEQKDFVAIIGPNGGGKTTLVKLILGLLNPLQGTIKVDGKSPREASPSIGYVPQNVHMNHNFPITVMDVVLMGKLDPKQPLSSRSSSNRMDALAALEHMDMAAYADKKIGMLSGGQRQRVLIARALVTKPKLLLLDEPTASIDTKGRDDLYQLLNELNQKVTVLVVSHDLLVISRYVKSIACVNKSLHYHDQAENSREMLDAMFLCSVEEVCPVELMAHVVPQRPLGEMRNSRDD